MKALVAIAVATAAAAVAAADGAPRGASALPCATSQLSGRVGETQGAAGTIAFSVVLRNVSRDRCALGGYPALQLRNAKGNLRTRVKHGGLPILERAVKRFLINPGGRATLLLAYSHVPVQGEKTCPTATALYVKPAGALSGVRVAVKMDPCNRGLVYESPLLPGAVPVP